MNKSLKVGRLGAKYCWRIGSLHPHAGHASNVRGLQRRHYADRYTFDDMTQARIDAANKKHPSRAPRENPWRDSQWSPDFPKRLDEMGYESHCNDRLYIAKNKQRHTQQEYEQQRLERRLEAQQRVLNHFEGQAIQSNPESRRRFIMQDPVEHQKRQEKIIEMNRRRWQSRPEAKREINNSGITYRPDIQKEWKEWQESQRRLMASRERSEAETTAEAEREDWRMRSQSLDSGLHRRLKRLMTSEAETRPEAENEDWRVKSPRAEAEEAETKAEAEREDWRLRSRRDDWRVRSPRAEAEDEDWRVRSPRAEAEEAETKAEAEQEDWRLRSRRDDWRVRGHRDEDWRVKAPSAEAEDGDWPVSTQTQHSGLQKRLARLMERAEAEGNPEAEEDRRAESPRAEAEEGDWAGKSPRAEAEDGDWRLKTSRAEAEDRAWQIRSRLAEAEDEQWRLRSRREEAEDEDWRVKSPRADALEDDWRVRDQRDEDWRVRSQSLDSGLQKRLARLMERSEAETRPEAEEGDWQVESPRAEAEESPRAEAEKQGEAEDHWKAKDLPLVYDPNRPSEAWLKKREAEQEAQYWHSWHSCPANREAETTVEMKPHNRRKKVVVHPPSYSRDGQRRGYHQLVPPTHRLKATTLMLLRKRRPNGIEQQYHKFARQQTAFYPGSSEPLPEPLSNAEPMPKPLRVIPKKDKKKPKRKGERRPVEPPRFRMTIRSRPVVKRKPTPVASYSRRLNIPPEVAGPSFYMANLRSSVSEAWRTFAGSYAQ